MELKKRVLWPMVVSLLVAPIAASGGDNCSNVNVNAKFSPGNQAVVEASIVNGQRTATVVTLDGTTSLPKANNVTRDTCRWVQKSGETPQVAIVNPTSCLATFAAPDVGPLGQELHFDLTVTEPESGCTNTDTTKVNVTNVITNRVPVASATAPASVNEDVTVTLDGSGSSDPDGDALTYRWTQGVNGSQVTITPDPDRPGFATFTAPPEQFPNGETLTFQLTVSDGHLSNTTPDIFITVKSVNQPPVASIVCPEGGMSVKEGASVELIASASDPDQDAGTLSYLWSQNQGVPNADLSQVDMQASRILFTAPALTAATYDTMKFGLTVTDNGKLSSAAQCDVKVLDVTPPVVTVPLDTTKEATSNSGAVVTFEPAPFAHDAFYGDVDVTCDPASGSFFALGVTPVKCTASDMAEIPNTAEASFKVTVQDTTPPVVTVPANQTAEATGPNGALVTFSASALDLVDGAITPTCTHASGATFGLGITEVTCSATDAHSNTATRSFNVAVQDTISPAVTPPADVTVYATGLLSPVNFGQATATDAVGVVSYGNNAPAAGFPVGTTTITWTAKDAAGNTGAATSNVQVKSWTLSGFYSPIEIAPATNTVKAGATVPIKFEVFSGATELTGTSSISSIKSSEVSCLGLSATADAIDALATGGTALRYDTAAGQFIYNWQTPRSAGKCYTVTATTLEGSTLTANFKLK